MTKEKNKNPKQKEVIVIRIFKEDNEKLIKMKSNPYEGICYPLNRLLKSKKS